MAADERWSDPKNWTGRRYRCADDPRLVVPKRNPALGWTFNWAHPSAMRWFAVLLFFALAPSLALVLFIVASGVRDGTAIATYAIGSVIVTTAGCLIVTILARRVS